MEYVGLIAVLVIGMVYVLRNPRSNSQQHHLKSKAARRMMHGIKRK